MFKYLVILRNISHFKWNIIDKLPMDTYDTLMDFTGWELLILANRETCGGSMLEKRKEQFDMKSIF